MEIFEAKKKYKDIYLTHFPEGTIAWVPLNWIQFKKYRELAFQYPNLIVEIEDQIFEECVVENLTGETEESKAGIVTTVSREIIKISGATSPEDTILYLEEWRAEVNLLEEQMVMLVCRAFGYKPEQLEEMNYQEFLRRVAMAESMLKASVQVKGQERQEEENKPIDFEKEARELTNFAGPLAEAPSSRPVADLRSQYMAQRGSGPNG